MDFLSFINRCRLNGEESNEDGGDGLCSDQGEDSSMNGLIKDLLIFL